MNLHLLHTGPLSVNTYIVPISESEVIVIDASDCAFSRDEGSVVSYLASNKLVPVAVLLTHGHFDHTAGLKSLKKAYPSIPIAIHNDDSAFIGKNSSVMQARSLSQMGFEEFLPFVEQLPEPDVFLEDGKSLADTFSSFPMSNAAKSSLAKWLILHTPGHTEGSCCLYNEEERILLSGDTVFYHSWGRTDLVGGNERKIRQSLLKIMEFCEDDTMVYSGHDGTSFVLSENY